MTHESLLNHHHPSRGDARASGPPSRRQARHLKPMVLAAGTCLLVVACGGGGGNSEGEAVLGPEIAGKAVAGPISGGTVTVYELDADGGSGRSLGTASTDREGGFRVVLSNAPAGAIRVVVTGGSYASLADASVTATSVTLSAVVPSVASNGLQDLAITPLTSFADKRLTALLGTATPLSAAQAQAEAAIRSVYGIPGSSLPLHRLLPNFSLSSGEAAILALLFGAFDQLAILQGRSPVEILRAIGEDWTDGLMDGRTKGGAAISFGTAAAPATLSTSGLLGAMAAYLAPSNTATIAARNGVTFGGASVSSVQRGVVAQLQATWPQEGNNSALMSGPAVGTNTINVADLRKAIAVNVLGAHPHLVFGQAYATRSSTTSDPAYVVLPLTNVGAEPLCFVNLSNLAYRTAAGTALVSNGLTYVQGSVRTMTASSIATDTCIAPGESGLVTDIRTAVGYSAVASMEFSVQATAGGSTLPQASVVPQGYSVLPVSTYQSLAVTLKNTGSGPARLGSLNHRWVLFDDAMIPLHWGFVSNVVAPQGSLAAGATGSIAQNALFYAGAGRKVLVSLDFADATGVGAQSVESCGGQATRESLDECAQAARTRRLSVQDAAASRARTRALGASASLPGTSTTD